MNSPAVPTTTRIHAKQLARKKKRLIAHWQRHGDPSFPWRHARILDEYFQDNFANSRVGPGLDLAKNPYSVIALGGYGRCEQCVHSDVDLLFLFKKRVPPGASDLIQEFVYPLWDLGVDITPATRSLKECLKLAAQDFDILTPLLDARFVCGMSPLYQELMERLHEKVLPRCGPKLIDWLVQLNLERHARFGDSSYLLEPNLKEGQGGLRDYHTLLWIARIKSNLKEHRDLEYFGYLSHEEYISLKKGLEFILDVRSRLHHLTGRRCDQLHIEYQQKLAATLKFKKSNGQLPVERFLGELHGHMAQLKQRLEIFLHELRHTRIRKPKRRSMRQSKTENLEVRRGMLRFVSSEKIIPQPEMLIRIFEESARLGLPLSPEAKRIVNDFGHLIDAKFRRSPDIVRIFERILSVRENTFEVLNEMLASGFLFRFIPQFEGVLNRIQYNEYHIFPVDLHLLQTVQMVKFFADPEACQDPLACRLYAELRSRKPLLWAALLHDIGKAESNSQHADAGARTVVKILEEKGLSPKDIETVSFLVAEHLLLMKTATRRDINDEETALFCARRINSVERLKLLYLLTAADSMATGPKAWNEWNAMLLRDLFLKVLRILEKGELASRAAVASLEQKKGGPGGSRLPRQNPQGSGSAVRGLVPPLSVARRSAGHPAPCSPVPAPGRSPLCVGRRTGSPLRCTSCHHLRQRPPRIVCKNRRHLHPQQDRYSRCPGLYLEKQRCPGHLHGPPAAGPPFRIPGMAAGREASHRHPRRTAGPGGCLEKKRA